MSEESKTTLRVPNMMDFMEIPIVDDLIRHAREVGETTEVGIDLLAAAEVIRFLASKGAHSAPVAREEAINFLQGACRNWSKVPRLSNDDLDDVATELTRFRAAPASPQPREVSP